jgi:putative endonuclease
MSDKQYYQYIVRCRNGALYTGITTDIAKRIKTHNEGKGSKSVRAHGLPVELTCYVEQPNKSDALKLEYKIKQLSRVHKEQFINAVRKGAEDEKQRIQYPLQSDFEPISLKSNMWMKTLSERNEELRGFLLYLETKLLMEF